MQTALVSKTYRDFSKDRDFALEGYHLKVQKKISQILTGAIVDTNRLINHYWPIIQQNGFFQRSGNVFMYRLERTIEQTFKDLTRRIADQVINMRLTTYVLSFAGEGQALGLVRTKPIDATLRRIALPQSQIQKTHEEAGLALDQMASKVVFALRQAKIQEDDLSKALDRVAKVLPRIKRFKRVPNTLKTPKLKEADDFDPYGKDKPGTLSNKDIRVTTGFVDDELWNEILDEFKDEFLPKWRGEDTVFDIPDEYGDLEEIYGWQIEQNVTNEFVQQVRDGKVDLANQNGIKDFVWIAVVDDKTDECCLWRDGLTTTEIEAKLKTEHKDDECDVSTPPAHANCRCDIAPITDDISAQVPDSNAKDFETWLNS